jgi:hypothetical protein
MTDSGELFDPEQSRSGPFVDVVAEISAFWVDGSNAEPEPAALMHRWTRAFCET